MEMKPYLKFNRSQIWVLAVAILVLLVGGLYFYHICQNNPRINDKVEIDGRAYQKLVTHKDQEPLPPAKNGRNVKVVILMYHHVGDPPPKASRMRKDLTVSTADFSDQAKLLKMEGYTSIKLGDILAYSQGKFSMPKNPVVFTFDDGYDDVFVNALPILKQNGFVGSLAIITRYPKSVMGDNFYASWDEIAKAYQEGNEIVSHTQDHFDGKNPKYSQDFIFNNLTGSVQDIKDHLGYTPNILIYPYGHYTTNYIDIAKKVGFVMGVTIHDGKTVSLDNLMEIPRVRVHGGETLGQFRARAME